MGLSVRRGTDCSTSASTNRITTTTGCNSDYDQPYCHSQPFIAQLVSEFVTDLTGRTAKHSRCSLNREMQCLRPSGLCRLSGGHLYWGGATLTTDPPPHSTTIARIKSKSVG